MKTYNSRAMMSFDGKCPMQCRHCYTYDLQERQDKRDDNELIRKIEREKFDIIYVSQSNENFFDETKGTRLCYMLYEKYKKDIFIITRSFLSNKAIKNLGKLNEMMKIADHQLFIAVSVCAEQSYALTEQEDICPSPRLRLSNLERAYNECIKTVLLVRPVFPNSIIPTGECINLIRQSKSYIGAVVSSGLIVTDRIIERLGLKEEELLYQNGGDSEYLSSLESEKTKYLDVTKELDEIQLFCKNNSIPFFKHSIPALNYLAAL